MAKRMGYTLQPFRLPAQALSPANEPAIAFAPFG
jgi:hypothetical protein